MLEHLLGAPLALEPRAARRLFAANASLDTTLGEAPRGRQGDPGYDNVGGAAVIGVYGVLMNSLGTVRPWGKWATGYDGIRAALAFALDDASVRAIVLHVDSPGGMCAGLFDLCDVIYAARAEKPVIAICESAYSAGYALASAAEFVTVSATGGLGSIGVISALTDMSGALGQSGISVHFVHFGAKKAEASRAELTGVTDSVLADMQRDVDRLGEMFVADVARNRGLEADAVRATEAACFMGSDCLANGLADRVCSPDTAFVAVLADLGAA
jgi:capsid assembly protease